MKYTQDSIDLADLSLYRDLAKPVGAIGTEERCELFRYFPIIQFDFLFYWLSFYNSENYFSFRFPHFFAETNTNRLQKLVISLHTTTARTTVLLPSSCPSSLESSHSAVVLGNSNPSALTLRTDYFLPCKRPSEASRRISATFES